MKRYLAATFATLVSLSFVTALAGTAAATVCSDGSYSYSSGRGTCSWHGGISGGGNNSYGSNNSYGRNNGYGSNNSYGYNNGYGSNNGW